MPPPVCTGTAPVLHLSTLTENGQFSTERAETVLTDGAMQAALLTQIADMVRVKGFAGVDVDFEYLPGYLSGAYAAFLERLRRILRPIGRFLWVALAPKTSADQRGLLYEGHDYAALDAAVDAALLMTYEWGYTAGPPMAVAPAAQRPGRAGLCRDGAPGGKAPAGRPKLRL